MTITFHTAKVESLEELQSWPATRYTPPLFPLIACGLSAIWVEINIQSCSTLLIRSMYHPPGADQTTTTDIIHCTKTDHQLFNYADRHDRVWSTRKATITFRQCSNTHNYQAPANGRLRISGVVCSVPTGLATCARRANCHHHTLWTCPYKNPFKPWWERPK